MASSKQSITDLNESEEEALLQSDDDSDPTPCHKPKSDKTVLPSCTMSDEDSLVAEAERMLKRDPGGAKQTSVAASTAAVTAVPAKAITGDKGPNTADDDDDSPLGTADEGDGTNDGADDRDDEEDEGDDDDDDDDDDDEEDEDDEEDVSEKENDSEKDSVKAGKKLGGGGNNAVGDNDNDNDNDDDEDDDDDDDDSDEEDSKIAHLIKELEKDRYAYKKYLELVNLSVACNDLDRIRKAYRLFSDVYPLTSELWLKYLRCETRVAHSREENRKIERLFRRALKDYYSLDIAKEFALQADRCAHPDRIWWEMLSIYGLHCLKGREFFRLYREYVACQPNMSHTEKLDAHVNSYLKELRFPLKNMEDSFVDFKVMYEKNKEEISIHVDWETVAVEYEKAKKDLEKILPFEEKIETLQTDDKEQERSVMYLAYIDVGDKFLAEDLLQTIYERMVAECCLYENLWWKYVDFINYRNKQSVVKELPVYPLYQQDALDINQRALSNCTWSHILYIQRMYLMEERNKTREEVQEVLETSLNAGFQTAEPAVAIWTEYLSYLKRMTNFDSDDEIDILRKNFNLAWTILGKQWGEAADPSMEILKLWGRLEYEVLGDAKRGKELWSTAMASSINSVKSALWVEFGQLELRNNLEASRRLFCKALHCENLDDPHSVMGAWTRIEYAYGSRKNILDCAETCAQVASYLKHEEQKVQEKRTKSAKVAPIAGKVMKRKPEEASQEDTPQGKKPKQDDTVTANDKSDDKPGPSYKIKTPSAHVAPTEEKKKSINFKAHETEEIDYTKDHLRIFLSNLDYNLSDKDIRAGLPNLKIKNIDLIRSANGRSRGFGYMELESSAEVEKALVLDRTLFHGRPLFISSVLRDKQKRQKFKYSDRMEPQKLFVKKLPNDVTKEELEGMFAPFGRILDVRLVHHKSGKFKNIAYVEFQEPAAAGKAVLAMDKKDMRGQEIIVAISAPPPKPTPVLTAALPVTNKFIGLTAMRPRILDQRPPRLSLIPSAVRKKLSSNGPPAKTAASIASLDAHPSSSTPSAVTSTAQDANGGAGTKTNEDFRKMLN